MDTIQIDWKNEQQKLLVMRLLKALHIKFRVIDENHENQLYKEVFKKSILAGKAACDSRDSSQFVTIKRENIFQ